MGKILSYYTKYLKDVPDYNKWNTKNNSAFSPKTVKDSSLKKDAKLIAEPILLFDKYEHERMEDSETFYQTFNIELMSLATLVSSLPAIAVKSIPFLSKRADKSTFAKKTADLLTRFNNSPAKMCASIGAVVAGALLFAGGIKHSMESQLGVIRKAGFDASNKIIDNPKIFAELNEDQVKQTNAIIKNDRTKNSAFVDKLKDKVDINSSFSTVKNYNVSKVQYLKDKSLYFENLKKEDEKKTSLSQDELKKADDNKKLLESYMVNVEHGVLETLRKVETISNISYSAMFTGGFLEYLLTDKVVDVLKIKSKPLQIAAKIGVPLITYLLLNKNISDIENKAILATKYKYMKKFIENPESFAKKEEPKKQSPIEFVKMIASDMKEYSKFSKEDLPLIEEKLEAKKSINLTKEQETDALRLQKNTSELLNLQREHLYNQTVGIKAFSETILGPIDIISTAIGAMIGSGLSKHLPNVPKNLLKGLGAITAFVPAAIIEAKLTKQQKLAEKTAVMLALKDMPDAKNYALNIKPEKNEKKTTNLLEKYLNRNQSFI